MNSFWRIFWLEWTAIVRTKTLALLTAASVGWMYVSPYVLKGDGTAEGAREICIRYSLGGVFLLVTVALLAGATGSLARERAATPSSCRGSRSWRRSEDGAHQLRSCC